MMCCDSVVQAIYHGVGGHAVGGHAVGIGQASRNVPC